MTFETLLEIMAQHGIARLAHIARELDVSPQSVSNWKVDEKGAHCCYQHDRGRPGPNRPPLKSVADPLTSFPMEGQGDGKHHESRQSQGDRHGEESQMMHPPEPLGDQHGSPMQTQRGSGTDLEDPQAPVRPNIHCVSCILGISDRRLSFAICS